MNSMIAIRVNEEEKRMIKQVSKLNNCGISSWIKKTIFEKLEDEYDLRIINDYEERKRNNLVENRPIEELFDEYGV